MKVELILSVNFIGRPFFNKLVEMRKCRMRKQKKKQDTVRETPPVKDGNDQPNLHNKEQMLDKYNAISSHIRSVYLYITIEAQTKSQTDYLPE